MMFGRNRKTQTPSGPAPELRPTTSLLNVTVSRPPADESSYGRRGQGYGFRRLVVSSLTLDYTFLFLRQSGSLGRERFLAWAGTIAAGDAFVSTIVLPRAEAGPVHGEVSSEVVGRVIEELDRRDLIPLAQVHTHPHEAFISPTDRKRPMVSVPGFWSIIVPNFGFAPSSDAKQWAVYEYLGQQQWREFDKQDKSLRLIIDDSILLVG